MTFKNAPIFRTLLFAPGARMDLLQKAQTGRADALIFDLEDAVPDHAKAEARDNVARVLSVGVSKPVFLRINNPRSGDARSDLAVLASATDLSPIVGVVLPKADDAEDVRATAALLTDVEHRLGAPAGRLAVLPLIESCIGLRNAYDIARASPRVCGMSLASGEEGDFIVDLGGRWTPDSRALAYARGKLVLDSRAAGLQWLVDGVFMNLRETEALRRECAIAREVGFVGKMAIHPTQVDTMHEVFSPSAEEIEYATGLLSTYAEAEARGIGAVRYRGMMIDQANVRLARRVLALTRTG